MWCELLQGNKFLKSLYTEVPQLKNIKISEIRLSFNGRKFTIFFNMPVFAEHPPAKWIQSEYNTVHVEISFFDITEFTMKSNGNQYSGDIEILKNDVGRFEVRIHGSVEVYLSSEFGFISSVSGYLLSPFFYQILFSYTSIFVGNT